MGLRIFCDFCSIRFLSSTKETYCTVLGQPSLAVPHFKIVWDFILGLTMLKTSNQHIVEESGRHGGLCLTFRGHICVKARCMKKIEEDTRKEVIYVLKITQVKGCEGVRAVGIHIKGST